MVTQPAPPHPQPWTAATDVRGRYRFETGTPWFGRDDVLSIKIRAKGFPDLSTQYFGAGAQESHCRFNGFPLGEPFRGGLSIRKAIPSPKRSSDFTPRRIR